MQTEQKRQTQDTPEIQESRQKKKGSAVLQPDETPSYAVGFIVAAIFLLGNLLIAAIYFHVINP